MTPVRYIDYITRLGDTFDLLALQAYNDEMMASEIIKANPDYADVLIFEGSVKLRLPVFASATQTESLAPWRRSQ